MSLRVDVLEGARIAARSLSTNRLRALLTTAGIVIGVGTLLAILGIIQGINASFSKQLAAMGSNTLYVGKFKWASRPDEFMAALKRKNFTYEQAEAIRRRSRYATAVAPFAGIRGEATFLGVTMSSMFILGTTADYAETTGVDLKTGRFLNDLDNVNLQPVAVLGAGVAESLFPNSNPIGASITLNAKSFQVIGVQAHKQKTLENDPDRAVIIPYRVLLADFGHQWPTQIAVKIDSADHMAAAEDDLVDVLRRIRQTPPEQPNDFSINKADQLMDVYHKLTGALYAVLAGIGVITLLVGGIGIMNIMLVSVRERTREIGVRRALGARKRTIVLQFLMEAAAVSAVGGAIGTGLGLGIAKIASLVSPLAAAVQPLTIVFGVAFAAVIGLLAGIWPAARAANLDPVEALRYE